MNPRLRGFLSAALGETCVLYAYTSSSMPPGGRNYSARIHVDCPRFIPGYVTNVGVTLMLDDFTEQSGATYLLPGSHRLPDPPSEDAFFRGAVRASAARATRSSSTAARGIAAARTGPTPGDTPRRSTCADPT